jgi:hypothetical protein
MSSPDETAENPQRPLRLVALLALGILVTLLFVSYARARGQAERLLAQHTWHWERGSSRLHFLDSSGWNIPFWEFTYESGDEFDSIVNFRYTLTGKPIPPTLTQIPRE